MAVVIYHRDNLLSVCWCLQNKNARRNDSDSDEDYDPVGAEGMPGLNESHVLDTQDARARGVPQYVSKSAYSLHMPHCTLLCPNPDASRRLSDVHNSLHLEIACSIGLRNTCNRM